MKALFTLATLIFWGLIALLAVPGTQQSAPAQAVPGSPPLSPAEVARHASRQSCWMAIGGGVYDLTEYVDIHPADPQVILRHCGTEASQAFATKDAGRPHSARAAKLLDAYRIGTLRP